MTTALTHKLGTVTLDSVSYGLDTLGRRTFIGRPNGDQDGISYDASGQVLSGTHLNSTGTDTDISTYDGAGNRITSKRNDNITLMTTDSGAVEGAWRCSTYGGPITYSTAPTPSTFATRNPFRFSSKYLDHEVETRGGIYYYGYRYYSPELGRWLSRDPIGEEGGVNLYAMVGNDAVNRIDLYGLDEVPTNCVEIGRSVSVGFYLLAGGEVGASMSGKICDCYDSASGSRTGNFYLQAGVDAYISVGLGLYVDIFKTWTLGVKGPNVSGSGSLNIQKNCEDDISANLEVTAQGWVNGTASGVFFGFGGTVSAGGTAGVVGAFRAKNSGLYLTGDWFANLTASFTSHLGVVEVSGSTDFVQKGGSIWNDLQLLEW